MADIAMRLEHGLSRICREYDERLESIDRYYRGRHAGPYMPRSANNEYKLLAKRAIHNWLPWIVSAPLQNLQVSGFRPSVGKGSAVWDIWQANQMDSRQRLVHEGALVYGHAYVVVVESPDGPKIKPVSPMRIWAAYADPVTDEFPLYAIQVDESPHGDVERVRYYDERATVVYTKNAGRWAPESVTFHSFGVTPVIRFAANMDLLGRSVGLVEPLIPISDRINQTWFDLLIAQTFGSFKVRYATGMAPPPMINPDTGQVMTDPETGDILYKPVGFDPTRFMMAEDPDTKFGELSETSLEGFTRSIELTVQHMAAVSQTPPHYLLGTMANLSADALAAAESALMRKVEALKQIFGEAWESVLRLCAKSAGKIQLAKDTKAQVVWADTGSRSLAQTADAFGKLVTMVEVPPRALWPKLPGFTQTDIDSFNEEADKSDAQAVKVAGGGQAPGNVPMSSVVPGVKNAGPGNAKQPVPA